MEAVSERDRYDGIGAHSSSIVSKGVKVSVERPPMMERFSVGFGAQVYKFLLDDCISDGKLIIMEISFPSAAAKQPIE